MKPTERTLVLFKPDALTRNLVGTILQRFERAGLQPMDFRRTVFSADRLEKHYAELRAKHPRAYERNAGYLPGKPVLAVILEGSDAVAKVRRLVGSTEPAAAPPGTIRGDYSSDTIALADAENRGLYNLVHAADSVEAAEREIQIWFQS
jgi:nucleoside-diphosphate kinase